MVSENKLISDPIQIEALQHLQNLQNQIIHHYFDENKNPKIERLLFENKTTQSRSSINYFELFYSNFSNKKHTTSDIPSTPTSFYFWGGTGCGKTFLMDLFHSQLPIPARHKTRIHFHDFMINIHKRIHKLKAKQHETNKNIIHEVGKQLLSEIYLLCLDELQVTDIADAMVLRTLFQYLFDGGMARKLFPYILIFFKTFFSVFFQFFSVFYKLFFQIFFLNNCF
jgi:protein AFG1